MQDYQYLQSGSNRIARGSLALACLVAAISFGVSAGANQVFSFGDGQSGTTGLGSELFATTIATPINMSNLAGYTIGQVASGTSFSLLVSTDGNVFSFGENDHGQTGQGTMVGDTLVATQLSSPHLIDRPIAKLDAGSSHALLLARDGTVLSFGANDHGQLGRTGDQSTATPINHPSLAGKTIIDIAAGDDHSLLVADDGTVFSFGQGSSGQTGLGNDADTPFPTPIDETYFQNTTITQAAAGNSHSLLLADDGTVFSFGSNAGGRTGQGTTSPRSSISRKAFRFGGTKKLEKPL